MASGMYTRLLEQSAPQKTYGFERVDRQRQSDIVQRLASAGSAERRGRQRVSWKCGNDEQKTEAEEKSKQERKDREEDDEGQEKVETDGREDEAGEAIDEDDDDREKEEEEAEEEAEGLEVVRKENQGCRRYQEPRLARRLLAAEEYSRALFRRLGRSHTFSSRCKQRQLDPHQVCGRPAGEEPDYAPIREMNAAERAPTPPQERRNRQQQLQQQKASARFRLGAAASGEQEQQQQQQSQSVGPSLGGGGAGFSKLAGLSRLAGQARQAVVSGRTPERRQEAAKQRASPFGLVFRAGPPAGPSDSQQPVASTAVFGALGRMRYRARREELQQKERDEQARRLHSRWEIVNATAYVRGYERANRRDMQLAELARPTTASSGQAYGCQFCREIPELAAAWQRWLGVGDSDEGSRGERGRGRCSRCRRQGDGGSEKGKKPEAEAAESERINRLRAPTRASEGGVPLCVHGRRVVGPGLSSALLGFEAERPKSGLERVRSAHQRRQLIDAMSARLHSAGGASRN